MLSKYDPVYGKESNKAKLSQATTFLYNILSSAIVADFELRLYEAENLTPEKVCEIFAEVSKDYGVYVDENILSYKYGFTIITHLYELPIYIYSYAMAYFGAIQIFEMAVEDFDRAADTYMIVANYGEREDVTYEEVMEEMGLVGIDDKKDAIAVLENFIKYAERLQKSL